MVFWELDNFATSAQGCSWVTRIGHVNCVLNHENHISGAANRIYNFTFTSKGLKSALNGYFFELVFTIRSIEDLIKALKGFFECLFVIGFNEVLVFGKYVNNMLGTESRDFDTSVAVENGKEENFFTDTIEDNCVFHIFSPSWVRAIFTLHLWSDDSDFAMLVDVGIFGGDGLWQEGSSHDCSFKS